MRAQARRTGTEEEEESAFVSMTDMTVGFLFIIMIMLAFFASQIQDTEKVSKTLHDSVVAERDLLLAERDKLKIDLAFANSRIAELEEELRRLKIAGPLDQYLAKVADTRKIVLTRLRDAIRADFPDVRVELSEESDALRFQGEGLFASGKSVLTPQRKQIVSKLAQRLDEILPCYTIGPKSTFDNSCNAGYVMIEAVQIEGHTDNTGIEENNRLLSTERANSTFFAMTGAASTLGQHQNIKGQPVLSVAAYGQDRPVTTNDTPEGRATNRRIDLRFIMVTPQDTKGIEAIRKAFGLKPEDAQ